MRKNRVRLNEGQLRNIIRESVRNILLNEIKTTQEQSLQDFEWWGPARENAASLTSDQLDDLEYQLEDCYPDGIDATQLNDIMAYDFDWVQETLGITGEDEDEYDDDEEYPQQQQNGYAGMNDVDECGRCF